MLRWVVLPVRRDLTVSALPWLMALEAAVGRSSEDDMFTDEEVDFVISAFKKVWAYLMQSTKS